MLRSIRNLCSAITLAAAFALGTFSAQPATACPMCKIAHEDSTDPAVAARPRAYMYSILFMLSMPATIFAAFGIGFYRLSRKQQGINDMLLNQFEDVPTPAEDRLRDSSL